MISTPLPAFTLWEINVVTFNCPSSSTLPHAIGKFAKKSSKSAECEPP
jgi:hypothetical protein